MSEIRRRELPLDINWKMGLLNLGNLIIRRPTLKEVAGGHLKMCEIGKTLNIILYRNAFRISKEMDFEVKVINFLMSSSEHFYFLFYLINQA